MFDAKKLTSEQVDTIRTWADQGAQLADIQKRMEQEMDLLLTYMDTRFLVLDLGIEIQSPEADEPEVSEETKDDLPDAADLTEDDIEILPPGASEVGGKVAVTVDELVRPGMMVSGRVTFPDGEQGMWYVDDMGRLGIDPDTPGYRPSETDLMTFQRELQAVMEGR